ncbi:2-succinyl-5-enolpyruvyl-6-hydroxy-3-cyclohexene-1-carboxylic-acid synthase [Halovivax ruber XH-70]|uniref:2-succinyl-5-enolpyruvyl-6-hydroxy-3-cyclohexene-1-carboxylate synthase n=1 Tax=Halovivax ruber (strain DSM 18193 / JCM 13892 / XH-70) TaxID=797302 RepID=L0ICK3_HALRX|nr:2-succinyl-5-enolpyruvyl-6-hydroxy-3-cyclohexene-1-carboxylic-acid synthase [Halovivax ruber]AGB15951.1 2-succinyl-5-enolpyruvyl-6-hydroxy-3-cyclohexene-1-carboxylic-acid synthase [Halovivax ruber XH-70]
MTHQNRATLWGRTIVDELAAGGLDAVCLAPGSRSTPLTAAFDAHPDVTVYSQIDERAAAFFALGRSRRTGSPTALVCTSGTAAANFHPAVIEADHGRVPLVVLTADRPAELTASGANQTIDQTALYGDSVRWFADLPEPAPEDRRLRSVRTTVARALSTSTGTPAGPVHLNCSFAKPLDPDPNAEPIDDERLESLLAQSRDGPYVRTTNGTQTADRGTIDSIANALEAAERPLLVAGPADPGVVDDGTDWQKTLVDVAEAIQAPIVADPLSDVRFDPAVASPTICGGYDAYVDEVPAPDCVLQIGDAPTSKTLRHTLRDASCRQFLIDPAGSWREATFTATDLVETDPRHLIDGLADRLVGTDRADERNQRGDERDTWLETFVDAEQVVDDQITGATTTETLETDPLEGSVLRTVLARTPDPSTVFVSNSMPIRDADLFGRPRAADVTVLANRGASGIDGIVSSALGAGRATTDPLTLVTGDLALYHDSNGLLALSRCDVEATIVVVHNDGGGIFHKLPIEAHDPPFTAQFKTPHGLDFSALAQLYDFDYHDTSPADFESTYRAARESDGTNLVAVHVDAGSSHRRREELVERIAAECRR